MSSELESSLTSMDWLPCLSLPRTGKCSPKTRRGGTGGQGVKPPHSYASLIRMAIQSTPTGRKTLREIYQWITENFQYYQQSTHGWKNSIRHNLSMNKCFRKIPRTRETPGKSPHDLGHARASQIPDVIETSQLTHDLESTVDCSQLPGITQLNVPPLQNPGTLVPDIKVVPPDAGLAHPGVGVSREETAFTFPDLDFGDLSLSFHSLCQSIRSSRQGGPGSVPGECRTPLHTPVVSCSPLSRSPFSLLHSPTQPTSRGSEAQDRCPETPRRATGNSRKVLPPDWFTRLDSVRDALEIAGRIDWATLDLSLFPGLTENPDGEHPPLDQAGFQDLYGWLDRAFRLCGVIEAQVPGDDHMEKQTERTQPGNAELATGNKNDIPEFLTTHNKLPIPRQGSSTQRLFSSSSEIQDEFDWDSIV
ncbi:forkhead box protein J3-like isoform X2 [Carcharodon carcharias]|uniref:forkhead box protein J3-like isoform X2 n=1 Tax=Carcharodon carcharias TaxID=13397 RepID=UPI001B7F0814|nr:forkhead box protein J3-like isoform X2 [Carcharodon carcharias]